MRILTILSSLGATLLVGCLSSTNNSTLSSSTSSSAQSSSLSSLGLSSSAVSSSAGIMSSSSQGYKVGSSPLPSLQRIVGYVQSSRDFGQVSQLLGFASVTHLNYAFANPDDSTMTFASTNLPNSSLATALSALQSARANGLKVMAAFGGGSAPTWMASLIKSPKRTIFVDSLMSLVRAQNLDGLDIDLEGSLVQDTANYNAFVRELADSLHGAGKIVSAAVAGWQLSSYAPSALAKLDFVNVMAYDYTGPWAPTVVGPMSDTVHAYSDLNAFAQVNGVGNAKVTLGVPFYCYHYWTDSVSKTRQAEALTWQGLLALHPEAVDLDSVGTRYTQNGIYYANGRITQQRKTFKARAYGGIMIWELGQDMPSGDSSLLKVITDNNH